MFVASCNPFEERDAPGSTLHHGSISNMSGAEWRNLLRRFLEVSRVDRPIDYPYAFITQTEIVKRQRAEVLTKVVGSEVRMWVNVSGQFRFVTSGLTRDTHIEPPVELRILL